MSFNHFDDQGQAVMVDISAKVPTLRTAVAEAVVTMRPETLAVILEGRVTKGAKLSTQLPFGASATVAASGICGWSDIGSRS